MSEGTLLDRSDTNYETTREARFDAWRATLRSAVESLKADTGLHPTANDVWSLLCQTSGAGQLDHTDFFKTLTKQQFYPDSAFPQVKGAASYSFLVFMQTFLNEASRGDGSELPNPFSSALLRLPISHYNHGPWYESTNGEKATSSYKPIRLITDVYMDKDEKDGTYERYDANSHVMTQSYVDTQTKRASVSSKQCSRLAKNHVHALLRNEWDGNHALFVEEHGPSHTCVVNDPNVSSLQETEKALAEPCKSLLDSFFDTPVYDTKFGLCQTWSLFELECNIMGCAGIHQQLRDHYRKVLQNYQRAADEGGIAETEAPKRLEAALHDAYPELVAHMERPTMLRCSIRQIACTLLANKLCRRFMHIFNYTKYPTTNWPKLKTSKRKPVPFDDAHPSQFPKDKSNKSFTEVYSAYRKDNQAALSQKEPPFGKFSVQNPWGVNDACC